MLLHRINHEPHAHEFCLQCFQMAKKHIRLLAEINTRAPAHEMEQVVIRTAARAPEPRDVPSAASVVVFQPFRTPAETLLRTVFASLVSGLLFHLAPPVRDR
jgi:hypothetical protein